MTGRPRQLLALHGPTGSGKSTLSKLLAKKMGGYLIPEPIPTRVLDGIQLTEFEVQKQILCSKRKALQNLNDANCAILDRTIAEDREVFLTLHRQLGNLNTDELLQLQALSRQIESEVTEPTAIVCIRAKYEHLIGRMILDGRPTWVIDHLGAQLSLYERIPSPKDVPYVEIDSSALSLSDLDEVANWIARTAFAIGPKSYVLRNGIELNWIWPLPAMSTVATRTEFRHQP